MGEAGTDDQAAVFALLADPRTHGGAPVTRIDTHAASVFLAGPDAYKVKRAVRFPFLDFSTLEKRHAACTGEMEVNRANAPMLYLGLVPVTRTPQGLALGGGGEVVEWAVHLRRFDETKTLDRLDPESLTDPLLASLAARILDSHGRAKVRTDPRWIDAFVQEARATLADLMTAGDGLGPVNAYGADVEQALAVLAPLLRARGTAGAVRRCHGDLHLRNIALVDGAPVLFDAIEFNEAIATCDVLYDLAFLLMDLWHRGLPVPANRLLNRYVWGTPEPAALLDGLAALPLFLSLRAAIRAKVAVDLARRATDGADTACAEARSYFETARALLAPGGSPLLLAIGGLSGTGKSTLAARLAPGIGGAPGAIHLRSDIERKRLFGCGELERLPPDAYGAEATARTYTQMRTLAAHALKAGRSVILDAVHARPEERSALADLAAAHGAPFHRVWLEAPRDLLHSRVEARRDDASDATAAVVDLQAGFDVGPLDWPRLDAGLPLSDLAQEVERATTTT
ncbi:AAA family ATPase [Aquabacter cavernae]|uniref:bifunctional aminoglycoside phosphotransferase/ATP-binding protein n=1 Tax=Aquabacter cavernae TaxID=2496029 RepID=UPI000F8ECAE3|nr:bifunctional aminoglycoside phosphotransferase/ATP-binding protein [Aquabacter cavernae]